MTTKTAEEIAKAQAERDIIKVEAVKKEEEETPVEEKVVEEPKSEVKEAVEENKEVIAASEKTEEELEQEKAEAKTVAEKARIQKRIDKEVAKRKTLEAENAELKRQLAAKKEEGDVVLTEDEVERRAETKAAQKQADKEFSDACNRLADEAEKVSKLSRKDFDNKVSLMATEVGPIPSQMIGILDELEDAEGKRMGGKVLHFLVDNLDEYERVREFSPAKMGVELSKLATKLIEKPKPKPISKVPPPLETVGANTPKTPGVLTGKESMEDFVRIRNEQAEAHRKRKLGIR